MRGSGRRQTTDGDGDNDDEERTRIGAGEASKDIPFELVGKVAGAGAVAEASDVKGGAAARHGGGAVCATGSDAEAGVEKESGNTSCGCSSDGRVEV